MSLRPEGKIGLMLGGSLSNIIVTCGEEAETIVIELVNPQPDNGWTWIETWTKTWDATATGEPADPAGGDQHGTPMDPFECHFNPGDNRVKVWLEFRPNVPYAAKVASFECVSSSSSESP